MYFFWPEKYRGIEDFEVDKMLQMVEDRRMDLLENLSISDKIVNAPADILTVYAIYDVFSIDDDGIKSAKKWFIDRYKGRLVYYLENKRFLPEYRRFVWNLFYDLLDIKLKKTVEQLDLNGYIEENKDIKLVSNISEVGEQIKSWDEFKEVLIKLCRELFPYAENRLNRLLDTKSFKKKIVESFLVKEREELLGMLSKSIDRDKKAVDESKEKQKDTIKKQISEIGETEELLGMLDLVEHGEGAIFIEMDWMVKMLSMFDLDDFDLRYDFLQFYVNEVMNRFKVSSDKRSLDIQVKEKQLNVDKKENNSKMVERESSIVVGGGVKRLSQEKEDIIDFIAQRFFLSDKNLKYFKNYLRRLSINGKDCRMSSLKDKFEIVELDEEVKDSFEKLGIEIRYDVLKHESENEENIETLNTEEHIENVVNDDESLEMSDFTECISDPFTIFKEQVDKYDYRISNEKKLKKQFEYLCSTDVSLTQILGVEMKKNSFGSPKKKQSKKYYTIEVAVTGLRFLLLKDKDGKFVIDGLYNHDDYEKRVKEM